MAWKRYKLIESLPWKQEWFVIDTVTGQSGIETVEDHSSIIEGNKAMYAMTDERTRFDKAGKDTFWHLIGHVPLSIAFDVMKKTHWGKDKAAVRRWINDKDNRFFLTRPIRL